MSEELGDARDDGAALPEAGIGSRMASLFTRDSQIRRLLRGTTDRLAGWYLRNSRNTFLRELVAPALIAGLGRLIIWTLDVAPRSSTGEGLLDAVLVVLAVFALQTFESWALGQMLDLVREIGAQAIGPTRRLALYLATGQLTELRDFLTQLVSDQGVERNKAELESYFRLFFDFGGSQYTGVDSHFPSEFLSEYEWYLRIQRDALDRLTPSERAAASPKRFIVKSSGDLHDDWSKNTPSWINFVEFHDKAGIQLLWVEPSDANRLAERHHLTTRDVALWHGKFAVFFEDVDEETVRLSLIFPGTTLYDDCVAYIADLSSPNVARKLDSEELQRRPLGRELAEVWEQYVNPGERTIPNGRFATFLRDQLEPYTNPWILDAAAGLGCDSVFLMDQGYSVVTNEIDPDLRAVAGEYAKAHSKKRVQLRLEQCSWEVLSTAMPGRLKFDVVLVLGNSLCLVRDEELRRRCIHEFYEVLNPGGTLVIDERNFPKILEIKEDVPSHLPDCFDCSWNIMYHGESVRGCPWEVTEERILWRIYRNVPSVRTSRDVEAAKIGKDLELYPFKPNELPELLKAQFGNVKIYVDLIPIEETSEKDRAKADFYTYCAQKRGRFAQPIHA